MVREELINSAVSFLQDPSVANAPIEKRIAFLQSKNLTQDEINVALARAGTPVAAPAGGNVQVSMPPGQAGPVGAYAGPPPGYGAYPGYWPPPPPEVPRRDWRDWFIMATVMGGVTFGLYVTAKRYLLPLIKPPTPEQLTQDKTAIDESFNKAFATLETLEADTKALKEAEESRTTRLDSAITELEAALASLKESDRKRDGNVRRNADELRSLRDLIPKAIEAHKQATEQRVKDLAGEVKSLKTLISNRMGTGTAVTQPPSNNNLRGMNGSTGASGTPTVAPEPAIKDMATSPLPTPSVEAATNGIPKQATPPPTSSTPSNSLLGGGGYASRFGTGRATIPEWQKAAAKKSQEGLNAGVTGASTPQTPTVTEESASSS